MNFYGVIKFWFHEVEPKQRWLKDSEFDQRVKAQFAMFHRSARRCELVAWRQSALGRLSEIIILDQFSRNMYRGHPESFAQDPLALALAQEAVNAGIGPELTPDQRSFLYMPFMHSESALIHQQAVKLFSEPGLEDNLKYEIKHKMIIDRFGRYPHRNEILGRTSTVEEQQFLAQPGSSF
ncbi:MAG: DUF924 family protein [Motiliproteus sp.]